MKKFISRNVGGPIAVAAVILFTSNTAQAERWEFNGSPTAGGWKYDLSSRPKQNRTRFPVKFVKNKVSTSGGKLIVKSGNLKDSNNVTVKGGGIRKADAFNKNSVSAKCNMKGSAATVKRSQASFWLHPNSANSHEVDMFELKPNAGNITNFISWKNGSINKPENKSNIKFNAPVTGTYKLVGQNISGGRTKFTVTRNGGKSRSYNTIAGRTLGDEIVIHNKPWRFNSNLTEGKVATLECDYALRP